MRYQVVKYHSSDENQNQKEIRTILVFVINVIIVYSIYYLLRSIIQF